MSLRNSFRQPITFKTTYTIEWENLKKCRKFERTKKMNFYEAIDKENVPFEIIKLY